MVIAVNSTHLATTSERYPMPQEEIGWGPAAFVWSCWVLMVLAGVAFIWKYGSEFPVSDDWVYTPLIANQKPVTFTWLWEQIMEHRVPLYKLMVVRITQLAGGDFRALMYLQIVTHGALALALILTARRIRGSASYADAFFPLLFLHWGHASCFLWGTGFYMLFPVLPGCIMLMICALLVFPLKLRQAVVMGLGLISFPLITSASLPCMVPFVVWLAYLCFLHWRCGTADDRRISLTLACLIAVALVISGCLFIDYQPLPEGHNPPSPSFAANVRTTIQFLTIGLGPAVSKFWPFSGWVVPVVLTLGIVGIILAWLGQPDQRLRTAALTVAWGASLAMALTIGYRRAGAGDMAGLTERYVVLSTFSWCCVYLIWTAVGGQAGLLVRMGLFAYLGALVALNINEGVEYGSRISSMMAAMRSDMEKGLPVSIIAERHSDVNRPTPEYHSAVASFEYFMSALQRGGIGRFKHLREDPRCQEVHLSLEAPIRIEQLTWQNGAGTALGNAPSVVLALEKPQYVYAIRLYVSYEKNPAPAMFRAYWRQTNRNDFAATERNERFILNSYLEVMQVTLLIDDTIDELRLEPDNKPCVFRLGPIILLLPEVR